jgi:hypothetical protein
LEQNPHVPRDSILVDDCEESFAYTSVGLGRFDEQQQDAVKNVTLSVPQLGGIRGWWKYLTTVGSIQPMTSETKFGEIPQAIFRLSGTFVVQGDTLIYRWNDKIPGDHPDVRRVLEIAKYPQWYNRQNDTLLVLESDSNTILQDDQPKRRDL